VKKLLFAVLMLLAPVVNAGWLTSPIQVPPGGEIDWVLAPIGAIEFAPSTPSNYGLVLAESIGLANVLPADQSHVVVSPYFFVGGFVAADIGMWVNSNGQSAISLDYGLMVGLPKLDDTLPEVAFSAAWNSINRGDAKLMINVAFPADILPDILVHRL